MGPKVKQTPKIKRKIQRPPDSGSSHAGCSNQNWDREDMAKALDWAAKNEKLPRDHPDKVTQKHIAEKCGVPYSTFNHHYRERRGSGSGYLAGGPRKSRVLTKEDEDDLVATVMEFARRGFPFTKRKLRLLAYEYAKRNRRKGFSPIKQIAGKKWLSHFMKRHKQLKIKNNHNLSVYRARCANRPQIIKWFTEYRNWLHTRQITHLPNSIWNIDETGAVDQPKDGDEVIGIVHEPAITLVAGELGQLTTILTYVSAGGLRVPPMVIFKGSKVQKEWREAAPEGVKVRASLTGYVNAALFAEYGEIFIKYLQDMRLIGYRNLVLLDSHKSHLFNLSYMEKMKGHNVAVGSFPPHCTHKMQPLDDVPYAAFKSNFQTELVKFNEDSVGRKVTKTEFFKLFIPSFEKAFTYANIQAGFRNCGIYPPNPNAAKLMLVGPSRTVDDYNNDSNKDKPTDDTAATADEPVEGEEGAEGGEEVEEGKTGEDSGGEDGGDDEDDDEDEDNDEEELDEEDADLDRRLAAALEASNRRSKGLPDAPGERPLVTPRSRPKRSTRKKLDYTEEEIEEPVKTKKVQEPVETMAKKSLTRKVPPMSKYTGKKDLEQAQGLLAQLNEQVGGSGQQRSGVQGSGAVAIVDDLTVEETGISVTPPPKKKGKTLRELKEIKQQVLAKTLGKKAKK